MPTARVLLKTQLRASPGMLLADVPIAVLDGVPVAVLAGVPTADKR
jgi:hypothetical protein